MKVNKLVWLFIGVLFLVSCKSKQGVQDFAPEYNPYVNVFTSGNISIKSNITVQLSENSIFTDDDEIPAGLFSISPAVKGSVHLMYQNTAIFVPAEPLKVNQKYTVVFDVGKAVKNVDKQYRKFEFSFSTIKPSFYMLREGLKLYDETSPHLFKLVRDVHVSDYAEPAAVEKMLTVKMKDKTPLIKWEHEGNRHTFIIDSISAGETASEIGLNLNAKSIGGDITDEEAVRVPSKYEFDILHIHTSEDDNKEQVITCRFSAPLDAKQTLKGIVTLDNARFTYRIVLNTILIYPSEKLSGQVTLSIFEGLKSANGGKFGKNHVSELMFESSDPEVKFLSKGNILPTTEVGTVLPFQAVSLKSVTVKIIKIYENNILQFLQVNDLDGSSQVKRAGRLVAVKTIRLDENKTAKELKHWNTYALDLSKLITPEQGAVYRIELMFSRHQAIVECGEIEEDSEVPDEQLFAKLETDFDNTDYYYDDYGYSDYYDDDYGEGRKNPCNKSYYRNNSKVRAVKNVLASDLGIIAKMGTNNSIRFIVSNVRNITPIASVGLEVYNFQQQIIGSGTTNSEGFADVSVKGKPFIAIAKYGTQKGYLHIYEGKAISLSRFDVAGSAVNNGVKGFIYGERGVWRPGDSIFLTFILQDPDNNIPPSHPVILEIHNAAGQLVNKQSKIGGTNGFYTFVCPTSEDAPTGNWSAVVKVGGLSFHKTLKIETIKPNKLKINLEFKEKELDLQSPVEGTLAAAWLHGAPVRNLDTEITLYLDKTPTAFKGYELYVFDDKTKEFEMEQKTFYSGKLDESGNLTFKEAIEPSTESPGKLRANFITRVFEESGDFSIDNLSMEVSPYSRYVGILQPKGTGYGNMLETDKDQTFDIVLLDKAGNPVADKTALTVSVHKLGWSWWWSASTSENQLANFNHSSYKTPVHQESIQISGGRGIFSYKATHSAYGYYLIRIADSKGHSTSTVAYYDWPGWGGRARQETEGATMLMFASDKETYNVGETAVIKFPSTNTARALISIENGTKTLQNYWVNCLDGETAIEIKTAPDMTPNVYVSITLVQPHAQAQNDLPIRLFGVIPLKVEDPASKLKPVLTAPETIRPSEKYKITVSESSGIPMTYTLAVVDEGLLDLTRFKTPNPWHSFYAKEALGVNTWDMYEFLIGAYGGHIEQMFAIGGGDAAAANRTKVNRFKPVVRFIGPFTIDKGQKQTHELEMHNYIGSVRIMVVAGNKNAYGVAEKTVAVKQPLMALATLPRVLAPGEEINLPVTIFALDSKIDKVDVSLETNDLFVAEETGQSLQFSATGEKTTTFKVKVKEKIGAGKVKIIATSGNERSVHETDILVRTSNPSIISVQSAVMEAGKKITLNANLPGMEGTNTARIEASTIPPLNLGKRLEYLIRYPHGCLEQTTSAAFPQLYLNSVFELSERDKTNASYNVKAALGKLKDFFYDGGFAYWTGDRACNEWATNYAGDFLLEAEKKGFALPAGMKQEWIKFQQKKARIWTANADADNLIQAYRLYTLAKAKTPEQGAMNRLKDDKTLSSQARWVLAAAYALAGQPEVGITMIENADVNVKEYTNAFTETFGSSTRDMAMILDALILTKRETQAFEVVETLSKRLNSDIWLSTQSTAYALMGISRYAESMTKNDKSITLEYAIDGKTNKIDSKKQVWTADAGKISSGKFEVENKSKNTVFVQITTSGQPAAGQESEHENKIKIDVNFVDRNNNPINCTKIKQGTDFKAVVSVTNLSPSRETYTNLALTEIFPSGWEIGNDRLYGLDVKKSNSYDYCDIRDDRVYIYFGLNHNTEAKKTFTVSLNAAYIGKFYLPAFKVEAMYDGTIAANTKGQWVEVVKND
ncbi:MAG: Ig-like domain-containing protein [Prevotellaceae bacterium]|jgi:uncharacterized protein YfaS (alpha-2-macroglobulin family)|nr:Ig-like domain-containing protein [Prevotellaceae bacterium]